MSSHSSPLLATHTTVTVAFESSLVAPPSVNPGSSDTGNTCPTQIKVASGSMFAIVGIFGLILVMITMTFLNMRRNNKRWIESAVPFDPVIVRHAVQRRSHKTKSYAMYNQYSPRPSHFHGGPSANRPRIAAQLCVPPVTCSPPPPLIQKQHSHPQRHLSLTDINSSEPPPYASAKSLANYSTPMSDERRELVELPMPE